MVFAGLVKYGVYILFPTAYLLYYEIDHVIVKWIMRQPCFDVLVLATVHNVAIYIYICYRFTMWYIVVFKGQV